MQTKHLLFTLFSALLLCPVFLRAQYSDKDLYNAYLRRDMDHWKQYLDANAWQTLSLSEKKRYLNYEYGYCGFIVAEAKKEGKEALLPEAKRYVQQFREHVEAQKGRLPAGHYEMYMSAVMVYELRLHIAIRPIQAMRLAKEATRLAPEDPLVLSYYGTSLFYAPKPFGSKSEALTWFEKAEEHFRDPQWNYCWVREATKMYIRQCHEKLGR